VSVGGYELNADLNAAYNIRNIHQALLGLSLAGGSKSVQSSDLSYPPIGLPISEVQAVRRKKTVVDLPFSVLIELFSARKIVIAHVVLVFPCNITYVMLQGNNFYKPPQLATTQLLVAVLVLTTSSLPPKPII
jgi:hypothetical protein